MRNDNLVNLRHDGLSFLPPLWLLMILATCPMELAIFQILDLRWRWPPYEISLKFRVARKKNRPKLDRTNRLLEILSERGFAGGATLTCEYK